MNIKNVISVERTKCCNVRVRSTADKLLVVAEQNAWQVLDIIVPARLELSEKDEDKQRIFSARLTIISREALYDHYSRWAYRCRCADGSIYIIGGKSRPYPVTTETHTLSDNVADSSLPSYVVEYSSSAPVPSGKLM